MNNLYKIALVLFIATALASCKKDSNKPILRLSQVDTAKIAVVAQGQAVLITVNNPGDGGYEFNEWQYDTSILHLDSHIHTPPANAQSVGDFGTDTWQFTSVKSGTTSLKLTASRGSVDVITIFNDKIKVN
jgi:predicted secreted protein